MIGKKMKEVEIIKKNISNYTNSNQINEDQI
jgi:hypothetical protein